MSEPTAECAPPKQTALTNADVVAYLRNHPDFFQQHPNLLNELALPHGQSSTASLLERQASVLRQRNTELRHKLNEFMAVARTNDRLFAGIKKLGLRLLEIDSVAEFSQTVHQVLKQELELDYCRIFVFQRLSCEGITSINQKEISETLGDLYAGDKIICSALRERELKFLFQNYEQESGSAALIPLKFHKEFGILAIGSADPNHFHSGMETDFAQYYGDMLSRKLSQLLNRSANDRS